MSEGGDWFADSEGNLTGPGGAEPATDEFGRDDPASVERERRRREREERRGKSEAKRRGSADGAAPRPPEAKDGAAGPPRTSVAERAAARRDALRGRIEGRPGGGRAVLRRV